jgi:hypothetical protein
VNRFSSMFSQLLKLFPADGVHTRPARNRLSRPGRPRTKNAPPSVGRRSRATRLHSEADHARRRYDAVAPEPLEHRENAALERAQEVTARFDSLSVGTRRRPGAPLRLGRAGLLRPGRPCLLIRIKNRYPPGPDHGDHREGGANAAADCSTGANMASRAWQPGSCMAQWTHLVAAHHEGAHPPGAGGRAESTTPARRAFSKPMACQEIGA